MITPHKLLSLTYGAFTGLAKAILAAFLLSAPASAEGLTIVAVGDSLTQGYGLPVEDGFVPQLEGWLQAQGNDVQVINAGVSGDTTAGGRARLGWTLTPEIDAVIIALGGNDVLRGIPPEASRENIDAMLQETTARDLPVLLIGLSAPGNYGPDYQSAFNAIFPELSAQYGTLLIEDFFAAFEASPEAFGQYMQSDGIHPNASGVVRLIEEIGPRVQELAQLAAK